MHLVHFGGWLSSNCEHLVIWVMLEGNLLLAVITGVGHTVTLNEELGGSLW